MTNLFSLATRYARFKGTRIIEGAYKIHDEDGTIVFVLESGPKLRMTGAEMSQAIDAVVLKPKAGVVDLSDGVNDAEAALAGKALQARKKKEKKYDPVPSL